MRNNKDKALAQKIAEINSLWDNEEKYTVLMPSRDMYCLFDLDDEEVCSIHNSVDCVMPNLFVFDSVMLDENSDWLSWELEMME